jgi:hypothetical protein
MSEATVRLAGGIPFMSDADLEATLAESDLDAATADAIVDDNADARLDGLRAALSVMALLAVVALFFTRSIPTEQPVATPVG